MQQRGAALRDSIVGQMHLTDDSRIFYLANSKKIHAKTMHAFSR